VPPLPAGALPPLATVPFETLPDSLPQATTEVAISAIATKVAVPVPCVTRALHPVLLLIGQE
jgi:hypothetical protein